MKVAAVVSTKGGPGKTTVGANPGAFCADAGLRTLLIDLDTQPSLSSFYTLTHEAPGGTYPLIANNETRADQVISKTRIPNLRLKEFPHIVWSIGLATHRRSPTNRKKSGDSEHIWFTGYLNIRIFVSPYA